MTDSREPVWHRSGDITFPWRGQELEIYLPTIGEMREIEEYGVSIAESLGVTEKQERLREIMDELAAAQATGDEELIAETNARITAESEQTAKELNEKARLQSVQWFQKVIELCGSDNWPTDPDDWPAPCRSTALVTKVKEHWGRVPLEWGAPNQNGAHNPTTVNSNFNS